MTADIRSAAFGGKRSPQQVLANALGESEQMEAVLVCCRYKDGIVRYAWSDGQMLMLMGLAAQAIHDLSEHAKEPT